MKTASTEYLILELTRMCNMICPHCLRGACQNYEMSFETAVAALNQFDYIGSITFTGGEPTLCGDMMEKIVDYIIANNINVGGFYVASNGLEVNMKAMFALTKLYAYIYQNYGVDEGQCVFDISLDQYHDSIPELNDGILHAFAFVSERGEISDRGLIKEGRAQENGIGSRYMNHYEEFEPDEDGNNGLTYETVYVNAKGNILPCCDFSYETQDYLSNVNIRDGKFNELSKKYNEQLVSK